MVAARLLVAGLIIHFGWHAVSLVGPLVSASGFNLSVLAGHSVAARLRGGRLILQFG